jgi:hypothetical protein
MGQRAKISSLYDRLAHASAVKAPKPYPCSENDDALAIETAAAAEREARAILAETEPGEPWSLCYTEPWGAAGRRTTTLHAPVAMACALAESLRRSWRLETMATQQTMFSAPARPPVARDTWTATGDPARRFFVRCQDCLSVMVLEGRRRALKLHKIAGGRTRARTDKLRAFARGVVE